MKDDSPKLVVSDARPFEDLLSDKTALLWFINRSLFHPRGFALALNFDKDPDTGVLIPQGWQLEGDGLEPWTFETTDEAEMLAKVNELLSPASYNPYDGDHIVHFDEAGGWTIRHSLQCRKGGDLFGCAFTSLMGKNGGKFEGMRGAYYLHTPRQGAEFTLGREIDQIETSHKIEGAP